MKNVVVCDWEIVRINWQLRFIIVLHPDRENAPLYDTEIFEPGHNDSSLNCLSEF